MDPDQEFAQKIATHIWEGVNFAKNWSSTCVPNSDPNCFEMSQTTSSGKLTNPCQTCKDGYYLENGICVMNPGCKIPNCKDYSSSEICSQCEDSHYLDCNECKERTAIEHCSILDWYQNKCFRCLDSHMMSNGSCVARTNADIAECSKYSRTLDQCDSCNADFFLTVDKTACFAEIPNCTSHVIPVYKSQGKMTCDTCSNNYYKTEDLTQCNKQNVLNCSNYVSNSSNICTNCITGYYYNSDDNTCLENTIANCKVKTSNLNRCTTCDDLHQKVTVNTNEDTCVAVNIPDCLEINMTTGDCIKCLPHRYLKSDGDRDVCVAVIESLEVDDCIYNTGSNSKVGCSQCSNANGEIAFQSFSNKHIKPMPIGCGSITSDQCTGCKAEYNSVLTESGVECNLASDSSVACLRNRLDITGTLAENARTCTECRNKSTHYKKFYTCWKRNANFNEHCSSMEDDKEKCRICKEGYSAVESNATDGPVCETTPTGFTAITGCVTYNIFDTTKCTQCEWGYRLSSDFLCVSHGANIRDSFPTNFFDYSIRDFSNEGVENPDKTEKTYVFQRAGTAIKRSVIECMDGTVPTLKNADLGGYDYKTKGIYGDIMEIECVIHKGWVQKDDGSGGKTPYVSPADCEFAIERSNTLSCIKCKNNINAKYVNAQYDSTGSDISANNFATVESCTPASDSLILSKKYKALGFRRGDSYVNKAYFEQEILYDTCPNEDHNLVVVLSEAASMNNLFKMNSDTVQGEHKHICYDFGSSPPVQNCHVFGVDHSPTVGFNYLTATMKCIACKPGYSPTLASGTEGRFISACTEIPNCDVSDPAKNTWMNGCETCKTGFVYEFKTMLTSHNYMDISECVTQGITNCLVKSSSTECALCDVGFILGSSNTACDPIPSITNCQTPSFSPDQVQAISTDSSSLKNYAYIFTSYISKKFESVSAKKSCSQCVSGNTLVGLPYEGSSFLCTDNTTLTGLTENCKIFSGEQDNQCLECVSTHVLDQTDACVAKSTLDVGVLVDNCKVIDSSADPKECTDCLDGYFQNSVTKECVKYTDCIEHGNSGGNVVCLNCASGKMVDYRDKTLCIDIIYPNCLEVDSQTYLCSKCEESYTNFYTTNGVNGNSSFCVKNAFSDPLMNHARLKFTYSSSAVSYTDMTSTHEDYYVSTETSDVFTQGICLKNFMPFCSSTTQYNLCLGTSPTCNSNHWRDDESRICIPNNIPHCSVQDNLYQCSVCNTGYFKNEIFQCQKQNVDDCQTYLPNDPGCQVCENAHYLKDDKCYPHSVSNCRVYSTSSDNCTTCNDFYYVSGGKCVAHTVSGCKDYDENADECDSCNERYYRSNGLCKLNTAKNCLTYEDDKSECRTCSKSADTSYLNNFQMDSDDVHCIPMKEIVGCIRYDISANTEGECLECDSGYFPENNKCVPFPTGVCNCAQFASPTVCSRCRNDFYMDPTTGLCQPIYKPIEHCRDYTSLTECKLCDELYQLSADFTSCVLLTGTACKDYATYDSCSSCNPGMILVESPLMSSDGVNKIKMCESKINNCIELVATENTTDISDVQGTVRIFQNPTYTCNKCVPGKIPNADKTQCVTTQLIANCYNYSDDGTCEICSPGYWLSLDKKKCSHDFILAQNGCKEAYLSENITCNTCALGYMMDSSGACVSCGGTGCAICNPDSSSTCVLCAPGYYMTSSKTCNKNENFSFSADKESISGGDPINVSTNRLINADEGRHEDDENFGMKISAMILGVITLLINLL